MGQPPRVLRRHAVIWLVTAGILFILWLVIWLTNDAVTHAAKKSATVTANDASLPTQISVLNEFKNEVHPIDFDTVVRDLRTYSNEFKDKSYFEKNRKSWTVQIMDVAEHKLIVDYLQTRDDREKFAYFRYTDAGNKERYVLTYGIMSSFQEAMGAVKLIDFKLPPTSRAIPEEMKRYLDMIDNYQRPEKVEEITKKPAVRLSETNTVVAPKPARAATSAPVQAERTRQETKPVTSPPTPTPAVTPAPTSAPEPVAAAPAPAAPTTPELSVPPTAKPTADARPAPDSPVVASLEGGDGMQ
ncbi:MAG: hypothetical protein Q4B88_02430 [Moraxella sp.]|nr:hypothetical protein [Moraxella sp.]